MPVIETAALAERQRANQHGGVRRGYEARDVVGDPGPDLEPPLGHGPRQSRLGPHPADVAGGVVSLDQ